MCIRDRPKVHQHNPLPPALAKKDPLVLEILEKTHFNKGYALVLGISEKWMGLIQSPSAQLVGYGTPATVEALRGKLDNHGLTADRVSLFADKGIDPNFPHYFANLIVAEESSGLTWSRQSLARVYSSLRPYGGYLCVSGTEEYRDAFQTTVKASRLPGAALSECKGFTLLKKEGALPGATNYLGEWAKSPDEGVRFPLSVLWFGDELGHFKRSPQPKFINGVMVSTPKKWIVDKDERIAGKIDYRLMPAVLSDVYTGRVMGSGEETSIRQRHGKVDLETLQPTQYRPPLQRNAWKPEQPKAGERTNPLTGEMEPRTFPKSYGCDGGLDYGHLYTMRSATASYYDKRIESGTINLSGPRSGCTNSIIPANGVLNVPYYYEGCTCSYPLPMAMALVSMPQTHEQWTSWGEMPPEKLNGKIRRVGLNFGAPGDRVTESGTLWLDLPSVGGPSPTLPVKLSPENITYRYHHSLRVKGGHGWPWIAASMAEGINEISIDGVTAGIYILRLTFLEPDPTEPGERTFDVLHAGKKLLTEYDVAKTAGGAMRSATETFAGIQLKDSLVLRLSPVRGKPILSGLELIRSDLPIDEPVKLEPQKATLGASK